MGKDENKIQGFFGEYRWLSNFWPVKIHFDGEIYPSVEHAYQAAKCLYPIQEEMISSKPTAADAKRAIKHMTIKPDFHKHKLEVMETLLAEKFIQEPFRSKLLETGDTYIEETNFWKDYFWGVCDGKGDFHLGVLIMNIRQLLKD